MRLKHLSDEQLLKDMKTSVERERAATLAVLEHIQEVHRRKLYAELGYPSLFKYLTSELGYSESQSYRRIQAARLVDKLPEARLKIANGSLNLTNASKLQSFFSEQKISNEQKLVLLGQVEHKSTRECEQMLEQVKNPGVQPSHKLNFKLNDDRKNKWDKLQGMLAHQNLDAEALLEKIMDVALAELDPIKEKRFSLSKAAKVKCDDSKKKSRNIPMAMKRAVYQRAKGVCEWKDAGGGKCCSNYALQIDHIHAFALGGEALLTNLQLLCRSHHQRKTVVEWGVRQG